MSKTHDSQVTFFWDKNQEEISKTLEMCRPLIGKPIYSIASDKTNKIIAIVEYDNNVFLRVQESE